MEDTQTPTNVTVDVVIGNKEVVKLFGAVVAANAASVGLYLAYKKWERDRAFDKFIDNVGKRFVNALNKQDEKEEDE